MTERMELDAERVKAAHDRLEAQLAHLESWQDSSGHFHDLLNPEAEVQPLIDALARVKRERDALAAAIEKRVNCPCCKGKGVYLAYTPIIYGTDSDDEVADSFRRAERKCPDCRADPKAILAAHDEEIRQKVLCDEWKHDWPAIFRNIADEDDEKLSADAVQVKREILRSVENSKWLRAHDAALVRPLVEALESILTLWSEIHGDSEDADIHRDAIGKVEQALAPYRQEASGK